MREAKVALELGCGTCGSTLFQARDGLHIVAIDYSKAMLRAGQRKLREAGLPGSVDLVLAEVCSLPFRHGCFDTVYSRGVAFSYAPRPTAFLTEAYRVLRAGGRLAIDYMNKAARGRRYNGSFVTEDGKLYYHEYFHTDSKQFRRRFLLKTTPETERLAKGASDRPRLAYRRRPKIVESDILSAEEWWAVFYAPREARALLRRVGFSAIRQYPLGCVLYALKFMWKATPPTGEEKQMVEFLSQNRDMVCRLHKELAPIFRLSRGAHVFATARK